MEHKNWHNRLKLLPELTAFIFIVTTMQLQAAEEQHWVRGEAVLETDILALPPACKFIFEHPGANGPTGQQVNATIFDQPQYNIVKGNHHIHHYCWALISKQRYFRANGKTKRDYYLSLFMEDVNYVFKNTKKDVPNWPYFHILLIEQGEMLLIRGDYSGSLAKANEALKYKPDAAKAHILKYDTYMAMGNKHKAIETAQEGLKSNPTSDHLRKLLVNLGVSLPPALSQIPLEQPPVQQEAAMEKTLPPPMESVPKIEPSTNADTTQKNAPPDNENSKTKSYCRFCP